MRIYNWKIINKLLMFCHFIPQTLIFLDKFMLGFCMFFSVSPSVSVSFSLSLSPSVCLSFSFFLLISISLSIYVSIFCPAKWTFFEPPEWKWLNYSALFINEPKLNQMERKSQKLYFSFIFSFIHYSNSFFFSFSTTPLI